jgi:hypothetical protein
LSRTVPWSSEVALGRHAIAEFDLIGFSIDVDPVHDWRFICDAADEAGVSRVWVWEEVSFEGMAEGLVVSGTGVDVELMKTLASTPHEW